MLTHQRAARIVALALILTVISQLAYLGLDAGGKSHLAYPIWRMEALAGLLVAVLGFAIAARHAVIGGGLIAGGIFNLFQTGIGLTMFYQLGYGGEEGPLPVFPAVLGFSFFLYFAAKAAISIAAVQLGARLWEGHGGLWRALGIATSLAGLAGLLTNGAAMMAGMGLVFVAGAIGTAATLLAALALLKLESTTGAA